MPLCVHASELWRRTVITLRRQLAKLAGKHGVRVKLPTPRWPSSQSTVSDSTAIGYDAHWPAGIG
jgi:hypothetical protein